MAAPHFCFLELPHSTNRKLVKRLIVADDRRNFHLGLGYEHTVKWIPVRAFQKSGSERVRRSDRKFDETIVVKD